MCDGACNEIVDIIRSPVGWKAVKLSFELHVLQKSHNFHGFDNSWHMNT